MVARTGIRLGAEQQIRAGVLFDRYSQTHQSQVFEIRKTPIVISAFGLQAGETIVIYSVVQTAIGEVTQPFILDGAGIILSSAANSAELSTSGRYQAVFSGVLLLDMVCTYRQQTAGSEQDIRQPSGAQANRPNLFFANNVHSNTSHIIEIQAAAWLFSAYGLQVGESITVYSSYGLGSEEQLEPYLFGGVPQTLTDNANALVLNKSGRFRFVLVGDPTHVLLVGTPTLTIPQTTTGTGTGIVQSILPGAFIEVNNTNPASPIVGLNDAGQDLLAVAAAVTDFAELTPIDGDIIEFEGVAAKWLATNIPRKLYLDGGNF